jgi:hypothetical protein
MTTFATPPTGPLFRVVVLNQMPAPASAGLAAFMPRFVDALNEHAARVRSFHRVSAVVRAGADPKDRKPGEIAMNIRHSTQADPNGALGWHQVTDGVPDIEIPLDFCSGLTGDDDALDVVGSHELGELMLDPGANGLVDNGNGYVSAEEVSDRVQDCFYLSANGLHLSNFLLAAAWIPGARGPYDFMCALPSQLDGSGKVEMTQGGYDIEGTAPDLQDVVAMRGMPVNPIGHVSLSMRSKAPMSRLRSLRQASVYSRVSRRLQRSQRAAA